MVRMFVRHKVHDYKTWRKGYDDFDAERRTMGVTAHAVYQSVTDPHDITVWHDFADLDKAQHFADSKRLKEVMHDAGVDSKPQIWFTHHTK